MAEIPLQAPPELMEDMYEAYRIFETTSHDPQFQIKFRLEAGDCMIFDNRRVLHGRTVFEAKKRETSSSRVLYRPRRVTFTDTFT